MVAGIATYSWTPSCPWCPYLPREPQLRGAVPSQPLAGQDNDNMPRDPQASCKGWKAKDGMRSWNSGAPVRSSG
jgi:hypothetical protein